MDGSGRRELVRAFGGMLRAHRRRLGMTQEELADKTGLSARSVGKLEAGQITRPRPATLRLLADAFGLAGAEGDRFCGMEAGGAGGWAVVPAQLPADVAGFAGRVEQLDRLDALLSGADTPAGAVVISAIGGTAGVGKTALAVHWAHRVAGRFPDGQVFLDLHGFTAAMSPVEPADALDRLLRALGVPGERIPAGVEDRAGLWRSVLAGRRMLIVLDNAAAEAQVAPLLPGAPGCLVVVTSRRRLVGLEGAVPVLLDVLPLAEAVALFTRTAGEQCLAADAAELVVEAVQLCGRLPLAIRIAAARLRSRPAWRVAHLVERLRDQQQRLGELAAGQRSVTAALDLSYRQLSGDQQLAYRLLGVHPGAEFDAFATAALLDSTLLHAGRVLDQLLDAHLLQEPVPGRFRFHDLTRAHAAHTATGDTHDAALGRLLDYYRHTAAAAMDAAYPYEREHRPQVPPTHTPSPELTDPAAALVWLDTELPNLLAAARYATEQSRPAHLLHLSTILHRHLRTRGRYRDAETLHQQALGTASTAGDQTGRLNALTGLGDIHWRQGRYAQATAHYQQALQLAGATGNPSAELDALTGLGEVHRRQGRYEQATDYYEQALQLAHTTGHRTGELTALNGLGDIHRLQGRYEQAIDYYEQALQLAHTTGHRTGRLDALTGLGWIHWRQGRYAQAADQLEQALQVARATGDCPAELTALTGLGHIQRLQRRYGQAADQFEQVLQLARATGHLLGELTALTGLGYIHRREGRHEQAANHFRQLLDLAQASGDRNWQFEAWQGLGRLQYATGDPDAAVAHHERALALAGELRQPVDQARAHDGLAHAHHARAQHEPARTHWQHALDILTSLGIDTTEDEEANTGTIRAHLTALAEQ